MQANGRHTMKNPITKTCGRRRGAGLDRPRRLRRRRCGDGHLDQRHGRGARHHLDRGTCRHHHRGQRELRRCRAAPGTETPLTGDTAEKVKAAALARNVTGGGTIDRLETDADGNAAYEAQSRRGRDELIFYVNQHYESRRGPSGRRPPPGLPRRPR